MSHLYGDTVDKKGKRSFTNHDRAFFLFRQLCLYISDSLHLFTLFLTNSLKKCQTKSFENEYSTFCNFQILYHKSTLQKWFSLISSNVLTVDMQLMALSGDINDLTPKTKFFKFNDYWRCNKQFCVSRLFKLNHFEITGHTNSKLGTICHHIKV